MPNIPAHLPTAFDLIEAQQTPRLPLVPGPWRPLPDDCRQELFARLLDEETGSGLPPHTCWSQMFVTALPFWPGHALVQATCRATSRSEGLIDLVVGQDRALVLNGESPVIHTLNRQFEDCGPLPIAATHSEDTLCSYWRLFNNGIRGESGRFRVVERADDLLALGARAVPPSLSASLITPYVELTRADHRRRAGDIVARVKATIVYGGTLFLASYWVHRSGMVEMQDDDPLGSDVVPAERWRDPLRHIVGRSASGGRSSSKDARGHARAPAIQLLTSAARGDDVELH